jgi:hypothetical protein
MSQIVYNNRADILSALEKNDKSLILPYASKKLRNKKNIAMMVIKKNWQELPYVSFRLRNNVDFMLDVLIINGDALQYATSYLKKNELIALTAIKNNKFAFRHASYDIKNNKTFIMMIIKNYPEIFEFLSDNLKKDKEIIAIVIKKYINNKHDNYYTIFKHIPYELKNDKNFILELIKLDIRIFYYTSDRIKNDAEIILNIMTINDNIFNLEIRNKIELNNDTAYPYVKYILNNVSNNLINNKDFIKSIIEKCPEVFEYIPEKFRNDKDFIFELLDEGHSIILDYISDDLKNDEDFIIRIIENYDDYVLHNTLTEIKNNFKVVECSVKHDGTTIQFASDNLKDNEIILETAIENNINAINFASDRLKKNKTFIVKCLKRNKHLINYINTYLESTKLYNIFYELEYNNQDYNIDKKQLLFFWNKIQYFKYLTNFDQYIINITKQYYNECFTNKNILLNIYNCEEVLEILNHECNIIILALQDINLGNDYDIENLKQEFIERYPNKKLIFI